ncbi:MAG: hypothetical protein HOQ05_02980 [Corynebacteriales bacterium]|nr:hypothetical protein [Mycobacteriales bacterium]
MSLEQQYAALRSADRADFRRVVQAYVAPLYDYSRARLPNAERAAQAVHNALIVARERVETLRKPSDLRVWLFALTERECAQLSWPPSAPAGTAAVEPVGAADVGDSTDEVPIISPLVLALAELSAELRAVLELAIRHDFSLAHTARILGRGTREVEQLAIQARTTLGQSASVSEFVALPICGAPPHLVDEVVDSAGNSALCARLAAGAAPFDSEGFPRRRNMRGGWVAPVGRAMGRHRAAWIAAGVVLGLAVTSYFVIDGGTPHQSADAREEIAGAAKLPAQRHTQERGKVESSVSVTPSETPTPTVTPTATPTPGRNPPTSSPPPPATRPPQSSGATPQVQWADIHDAGSARRCDSTFWAHLNVGIDNWEPVSSVTAYISSSSGGTWVVDVPYFGGDEGKGRVDLPRNEMFYYTITVRTKSGNTTSGGSYTDYVGSNC